MRIASTRRMLQSNRLNKLIHEDRPQLSPLVMTTSFMFAGAHSFEGAVTAFAQGRSLARIRTAAATNHARGQGKTLKRVRGAFTNPSHKRWQRYVDPTPKRRIVQ